MGRKHHNNEQMILILTDVYLAAKYKNTIPWDYIVTKNIYKE